VYRAGNGRPTIFKTEGQKFRMKFTFVVKSVLLFWKFLTFEFLLGISETFLCSESAPRVKIVPLLDVHQLLMLFFRDVDVFGATNVLLNHILQYVIIIIITCMYEYYLFSLHNGLTIASVLVLLFPPVNDN
jgi:hypothetical protein